MFSFHDLLNFDDYNVEQNYEYQTNYLIKVIKSKEEAINKYKKVISDTEDELLELRKKLIELQKSKATGVDCLNCFNKFILDKYKNIESIKHILEEFNTTYHELEQCQDKEIKMTFEKLNGQYKLRIQKLKPTPETNEKIEKINKIFDLFTM